jgi:hypothetical protein
VDNVLTVWAIIHRIEFCCRTQPFDGGIGFDRSRFGLSGSGQSAELRGVTSDYTVTLLRSSAGQSDAIMRKFAAMQVAHENPVSERVTSF